jgi:hypothetical protein
MALTQAGVVTGRRIPRRLGAYTAEMARTMMPGLTARREQKAQFEQQQALELDRLKIAERGQKQGHQDVETANRIAIANLGVTGLLGMKRYQGLNQPKTDIYTAEEPQPVKTVGVGRGGEGQYQTGTTGGGTDQPWYSKLGRTATTMEPYAAGFGGGLLGSQIGGQIAGKKNRRKGKIAGGTVGGGAAGYYASGDIYGGIIGAVVGGSLGALL